MQRPCDADVTLHKGIGKLVPVKHDYCMKKQDITCPECRAGFRRIELSSRRGERGEYRCPICDALLEVFDGSTEVAYRLTVQPARKRGRSLTPVRVQA